MKMRELEERTGVGREAIRFYLREGLLPEPERPRHNVARYSEEHVIRIKAIKRLQEERFLPLTVIKALLNADDPSQVVGMDAFPDIDLMLAELLSRKADTDGTSLKNILAELNMSMEEALDIERAGNVTIDRSGPEPMLAHHDVKLLRLWHRLQQVGFSLERGFTHDKSTYYAEFVDWLTDQEIRRFYELIPDDVDIDEALAMAENGIMVINEILSTMRTKAILRRLNTLKNRQSKSTPAPKGQP